MGRSITPKYRVQILQASGFNLGPMAYGGRGPKDFHNFVDSLNQSTEVGGVNAHLKGAKVFEAVLVNQRTGERVSHFKEMFIGNPCGSCSQKGLKKGNKVFFFMAPAHSGLAGKKAKFLGSDKTHYIFKFDDIAIPQHFAKREFGKTYKFEISNPFVFVDYPKRHTKLFREAETGQFKRFPKRNPAKKYRIVVSQGHYARNRYLTVYRIVCDWDGRECPMSGEYRTRREACAAIAKLEAETGQFKRFPRGRKNPNGSAMSVMRGQAGRRPIGKIWLKDVSDGSVTTLSTHFLDASEFETWVARKTKEVAPYTVIIRKEFPIGTQVNPDLKNLLLFAGRAGLMATPHILKYGKRYLARRRGRRNPLIISAKHQKGGIGRLIIPDFSEFETLARSLGKKAPIGTTRQLYQKKNKSLVYKGYYTNPMLGSTRSPLREIYGRADMISATKGRGSIEPGQRRYHKFTTKPKVLGLPKGAVLYFPKQGRAFRMKSNHVLLAGRKDLWRNFKYRGNGI